jgi:hypothetical protein
MMDNGRRKKRPAGSMGTREREEFWMLEPAVSVIEVLAEDLESFPQFHFGPFFPFFFQGDKALLCLSTCAGCLVRYRRSRQFYCAKGAPS